LPPEHLSESNLVLRACFAFLPLFGDASRPQYFPPWQESSVQRIGGMIIAARGFWFFLPKQKEGPRQGLAESSFSFSLWSLNKPNLHCGKAS
jgi:hypothetical protein